MKKRRTPQSAKDDRPRIDIATSVCAWCGKRIGKNDEIVTLPIKAKPGIDLDHEDHVLELRVSGPKTALAIVPTEDSEAKKAGCDLIFVLCSKACALNLKEALETEVAALERTN